MPLQIQVRGVERMALFSFSGQIISRGKSVSIGADGGSGAKSKSLRSTSVAAAAYRSGSRLVDKASGCVFDYTRKSGVVYTEIMLPQNAPQRFYDRATLWNSVEAAEKQVNSQLARELRIALPCEFSREENIQLVRDFVQRNFVSKGMCADIAYHVKDSANSDHNPHVHIMLTMRPMTKSGDWWATKSKKEYLLDRNGNRLVNSNGEYRTRNVDLTGWNDRALYVSWREDWARSCNRLYERKNLPCRIDHRSYAEQGINRAATLHLGKDAATLERKGISTEKGEYNRAVGVFNEMAELGVEPVGLRETLRDIFAKTRERQRISRKARGNEPVGERGFSDEQPRPKSAYSTDRSATKAADAAERESERRTDAPLHGAVRQGDPAPQKTDENPRFSKAKTPAAAAMGERSYAQNSRSAIRHAEGTQNFLASRGAHSYDEILIGCRKAQAEFSAAEQTQNSRRAEIKQLRDLKRYAEWYAQNGELLSRLERFKSQSSKFYAANREAVLSFEYAKKDIERMGFPANITAEQLEDLCCECAQSKSEFYAALNSKLQDLYELQRCASFCAEYRESAAKGLKIFKFGRKQRELAEKFELAADMLKSSGYNEFYTPEFFAGRISELKESAKPRQTEFFRTEQKLERLSNLISKREKNRSTAESYFEYKSLIEKLWQEHKAELGRAMFAQKALVEAGYSPDSALDVISQKLTELILQRNDAAPELKRLENELRMWLSCENYARELLNISQCPADLPDFSVKKNDKRMSELERIEQKLRQAAERKEHFSRNKMKNPQRSFGNWRGETSCHCIN